MNPFNKNTFLQDEKAFKRFLVKTDIFSFLRKYERGIKNNNKNQIK